MAGLPDDLSLAWMSIPGTHDSLALCGGTADGGDVCDPISTVFTKTQENHGYNGKTLTKQFEAGIRSIDLRVGVNKDENGLKFTIHHGIYYQVANFDDVLSRSRDFLRENPDETVLLHVKAECTGEAFSCEDADGFATDEWRKRFSVLLSGRAENGYAPVSFTQYVRARMPLPDEVTSLDLSEGTPVIEITRHAYTKDGRCVEVNRMVLDATAYLLDYTFPA